ncbi:helix-turn-helix domain-containing protein [Butyricimonas faecihominis]|uniref:helix-turn-helix domain-containing protein n=1 Tax=Butyricimonas faecihominis TaxID=1472416 RepID=UPI0026DCF4A7|nr:helix-turn-helix transcriptional regulator [Butyricimonas faecihominis]
MLRVAELCKEKGITQQTLAKKLGIQYQSLYAALNGNPKMDTLEKIAEALGVSVVELFSPVEKTDILGIIRVKGVYHEVKSIEEIKKLVEDYEAGNTTSE